MSSNACLSMHVSGGTGATGPTGETGATGDTGATGEPGKRRKRRAAGCPGRQSAPFGTEVLYIAKSL